jgi:hypothetical protein
MLECLQVHGAFENSKENEQPQLFCFLAATTFYAAAFSVSADVFSDILHDAEFYASSISASTRAVISISVDVSIAITVSYGSASCTASV